MAFSRWNLYSIVLKDIISYSPTVKDVAGNLFKPVDISYCVQRYYSKSIMKVLNVAEKNDAAKNIAGYLSRGNSRRREGLSVYNKIFEFNTQLWGQNCHMVMTSVSGHLLGYEFIGNYRKWQGCHPLSLFDAPVSKMCLGDNYIKIKKTLEREVRSCNTLIIWTDCDREGENIGFEIIQVCQAVKPNLQIYRAKFSEITRQSIERALQTLGEPDKAMNDAVDVRSELDLRIGAAFTRFQTLRLQKIFPSTLGDMLISYGSCQFPTLGFVVERFLAIDQFKSEPYWKIKVTDDRNGIAVEFRWARVRLFEEMPCQIFLDICLERPEATVEKVTCKPKSKWRPLPLDTIEMEKQGSRKLRLDAKQTMKIAEKLYTQGLISYPRTETNIFPKELNLTNLVQQQTGNPAWGNFARGLLETGINPRQGKKSDQAHPPIHPTKYTDSLQGNEAKVYEFVVRHFLACLSKNAEGQETTVDIDIAGEKFMTNGLEIIAKNYLDVYIYDKWSNKQIHSYQQQQVFRPTSIDMVKENTSPPSLLTEAELIALMDKHGIGTDATHADHIDTIKSRQYVGLTNTNHFMPGKLGLGLVMGYDSMGFQMSKPNLRADLEKDLQLICQRQKDPSEVLQNQINKYREVFKVALERANLIDDALARCLEERPIQNEQMQFASLENVSIFKCPKCSCDMVLKDRRQGRGKYITCSGYPTCTNVIWLPETVEDVEILNETCDQCTENIRKLTFKLARNAFPQYGTAYTTCIGCGDSMLNTLLNIKQDCIRQTGRGNFIARGNTSTSTSTSSTSQLESSSTTITSTQRQQSTSTTINSTFSNAPREHPQNHSFNVSQPNRTHSNVANRNMSVPNNRGNANRRFNSDDTSDWENRSNWTGNSRNVASKSNTWGDIDNDTEIMCNCHEIAIPLTVKKDGPNKGRQFYKCAKPRGSECNFFLWADSTETQNNTDSSWSTSLDRNDDNVRNAGNFARAGTSSSNWSSASSNDVMCNCNQPARRLTVQKENSNKGRQFYGCPKGYNSTCQFFKWADEDDNNEIADWSNSATNNRRNGGRGRGSNNGSSGSAPKRPRLTGTKRKCGNCGIEGHTRKTCPENVMD